MKTKHHETAGGVVIDSAGRVLAIVRDIEREGEVRHEVRLPKGHIDPGETAEAAAVREVREESGYGLVEIIADLGEGTSEFDFRGKHHVRRERYFLMRLTDSAREAPAPTNDEEALFEPRWLAPEEAADAMTYESERDFVLRALNFLEQREEPSL
ncbi:MAG: NUDIX domain-containing protein [Candidatus Hydrogenedens sp.]|nr:NUDIX domain-containing protein [Candidatus Hydrogenedens sp.]